MLLHVLLLALFPLFALGQKEKPAKTEKPVAPTMLSTAPAFVSVEDAARLKFREIEFKANQLEIEIQRLQVKIEQDKQEEAKLWHQVQTEAAQYASEKKIDPAIYDFDAGEIKFVEKKKP